MKKQGCPKHEQYPNRYKNVVVSFVEPEKWGLYAFYLPKVKLRPFKDALTAAGGYVEMETPRKLYCLFKGKEAVLNADKLASPYMYKY